MGGDGEALTPCLVCDGSGEVETGSWSFVHPWPSSNGEMVFTPDGGKKACPGHCWETQKTNAPPILPDQRG